MGPVGWFLWPIVASAVQCGGVARTPMKVKMIGGTSFSLEVELDDTVGEVKKKISQQQFVSPDRQALVFNGSVLKDNHVLSERGVQKSSPLWLVITKQGRDPSRKGPPPPHGVQISVNAVGKIIPLDVDLTGTVSDVKQRIREKTGVSANRQHLTFVGQELDDSRALSEYRVQSGSMLDLVLAMQTGGKRLGQRYEGTYVNGQKHGQGTLYYINGDKYEGAWENDQQHGQGTFYFRNGDKYEGAWENGQQHGQGTSYYITGDKYEGAWENGQQHGQGTYYSRTGNKYEGAWVNGQMHGQGTLYGINGDKYQGAWENDQQHGQGTFEDINGDKYQGACENGGMHGQGTYYFRNGDKYEGAWENGQMHGQGTMYYISGNKYEGAWENGQKHGQGTFYFRNGDKYEGAWEKGQMHGQGT